jgi:hypothetical protein
MTFSIMHSCDESDDSLRITSVEVEVKLKNPSMSHGHEIWIRVVSPRKVSWFAPLNRYYIIIDEVFFDNFLVIIYLLLYAKK